MLSWNVTTALLAWMFGCGAMFGAQAQQPISAGQQGGNPSGWTFNVAPYLWMATIDSTANFDLPRPANGTVTAELSIGLAGCYPTSTSRRWLPLTRDTAGFRSSPTSSI